MAHKERNDLLDRLVYLALRVVSMALHSWGIGVATEHEASLDLRGSRDPPERSRECARNSH